MTQECKDCKAERERRGLPLPPAHKLRPARNPGPRCVTHYRQVQRARKARAHATRVQNVYGLPEGAYERLYAFQGQVCAICRRATGASRRLSVDHDHKTGLARMLLCRPCNDMVGHLRDDPAAFRRAADLLEYPPARHLGIVAYHQENREGEDGE